MYTSEYECELLPLSVVNTRAHEMQVDVRV